MTSSPLPTESTKSTNSQSTVEQSLSMEIMGNPSISTKKSKTRTRKIPTKEVFPEDNEPLVRLGMSPFMPGLDAISNQNRLVRNESILAGQVSRLQTSFSTSETRRAERDHDIYRILTEHKTSIDRMSRNLGADLVPSHSSILSDPDFVAHVEAHAETRNALNALIAKVSAYSASNKRVIDELKAVVSELSAHFPAQHHRPIEASSSPLPQSPSSPPSQTEIKTFPRSSAFSSNPLSSNSPLSVKRKRDISDLGYHLNKRTYSSPSSDSIKDRIMTEVVYGPIMNTSMTPRTPAIDNAIAEEAIRDIGLSPSMIHSVRPAPADYRDHLVICFLEHDFASRFVDLVGLGLDGYPERKAVFFKGTPATTKEWMKKGHSYWTFVSMWT